MSTGLITGLLIISGFSVLAGLVSLAWLVLQKRMSHQAFSRFRLLFGGLVLLAAYSLTLAAYGNVFLARSLQPFLPCILICPLAFTAYVVVMFTIAARRALPPLVEDHDGDPPSSAGQA
jgi:hypothetical protein